MSLDRPVEPQIEQLLAARRALDGAGRAAVEALRADASPPDGVAERLLAAARSAIERGRSVSPVALVIRAIGTRLEALIGAGRVLAPAIVRGAGPGGVLVAHALGDREILTHVDNDGDRFVVVMDLGLGLGDAPRMSVARDGRELASEVPPNDRWLLPRLSAGTYRIEARSPDGTIRALDLVLERPAQ